jgi:DNA-binding FrmR family transcriptional regulator
MSYEPAPLLTQYTLWGYIVSDMKTEIKTKLQNRLNRIEGQIRGLAKMVADEKYCIDIITQTSAVKQALSAVEDDLLLNHLGTHALHQIRKGEADKAIEEIVKVYKISKKK